MNGVDKDRIPLTTEQRSRLIVLTIAFIIMLVLLLQYSLPKYSGLPSLLAPLVYHSPTPRSVALREVTPEPIATTDSSHHLDGPGASLGEDPGPTSTPTAYFAFLPWIPKLFGTPESPYVFEVKPEPPPVEPTPNWPPGLDSQTASKLGLHVVRNNDPFIMEWVRRVRPRVMKSVDDLGWLADVKEVSPNTIVVGRVNIQDETWADTRDPVEAAHAYVAQHMEKYRLNTGVDFWEGWNEFVPHTPERWRWYAEFEATRACAMQAHGLKAAVGGFVSGSPEYHEMAYFVPALQKTYECGGIFTLHEGVSPLPGCGVFTGTPGIIPGAPAFPGVTLGYMMLRYRFWYEGYLKPLGIGDLPLVISELAVGGLLPEQPCNGPGGASWKKYQEWWVQNGVGPDGRQAWVNLLAWYDSEIRKDPYVLGTTIFTAGAVGNPHWDPEDLHDVLVPLAYYAVEQR